MTGAGEQLDLAASDFDRRTIMRRRFDAIDARADLKRGARDLLKRLIVTATWSDPPTVARLAADINADERTVRRGLRALESGGFIECAMGGNGRGQRHRIVVAWPMPTDLRAPIVAARRQARREAARARSEARRHAFEAGLLGGQNAANLGGQNTANAVVPKNGLGGQNGANLGGQNAANLGGQIVPGRNPKTIRRTSEVTDPPPVANATVAPRGAKRERTGAKSAGENDGGTAQRATFAEQHAADLAALQAAHDRRTAPPPADEPKPRTLSPQAEAARKQTAALVGARVPDILAAARERAPKQAPPIVEQPEGARQPGLRRLRLA